jgi:hypothetical protein
MNRSVDDIESISESFLHCRDSVELGVVRTHNSAVIADQLFARIAEVSERLMVKETILLGLRIKSMRVMVESSK